jgi:hypothetical protein
MNPSEEVTDRFLTAATDLLREVFEALKLEQPEAASAVKQLVATGMPIGITVLADRDIRPYVVKVVAPDGRGGTFEICHLERVRLSDAAATSCH